MGLNDDIATSAKWLDECNSRIDGAVLDDCTRNRVSAALLHLALEHHGAIQVLVSYGPSPLYGSAAALLCPQFEAYIRGVWFHRSASEDDIERYIGGAEPPKIDDLIRAIETLPGHEEGLLRATKKEVWGIMCGLTHGGSSQVASRNGATEIAGNYTDDQVRGILYWACSMTLLVSGAFANLLGNNVMGNEVCQHTEGFSQKSHNELVHLTRKNGKLISLKLSGVPLPVRRAGDHHVMHMNTNIKHHLFNRRSMKMKDRKLRVKKFEGIKSLTIVAFFCLALTVPTWGFSADEFKVTLLGTGTPVPSPDTFGPSTLVEAGGQKLVFDLGRGCTIRLWQKQIALGSIDAHFLTHLHSDHINGLPDLYLSGWIQTPFGGRKNAFVIYGPPGTQKMMANLWEAFSEDRRIRLEDEKNPLAGIQIQAQDFKPGVVYEKNGVVVTTFEVDHGDLVKPCYGFKITYKNHSVVISGDTRYSPNLEKAAMGADLLIHEVTMVPDKLLAGYPVYKAIIEHHISPEEAGKLFATTKPKLAVYTHLVLSGLPAKGIPFPTHDELLAATRKTYDGRVLVGKDLMSFKIDETGVSVIEPSRR